MGSGTGATFLAHTVVQIDADGETLQQDHPLLQQQSGSGQLTPSATPLSPTATLSRRRSSSRLALLSIVLLVFQGTALSIALRYSRVQPGQPYLASVSVLFTETSKLLICVAVQLWLCLSEAAAQGQPRQRALQRQAQDIAAKSLPMLLPAGMFVMQQVLLIIAATHLDAVSFQIFNQSFKLVPTALFAYWLLGQQLEAVQWASIPVLAVGVIGVTLNNGTTTGTQRGSSSGVEWVIGMVACSISGLSSAYAGVYFEKYVKGKYAETLWVRNIQLGMYGVPLSLGYALLRDGSRIRVDGWLQGFGPTSWLVIVLQVFGGLVTGMVVKFSDNILKNFALAISVILTVLVVIPLFGQWPSGFFLVGVALVLLSVFMYGKMLRLSPDLLSMAHRLRKRLLGGGEEGTTFRRRLLLGATLLVVLGCSFYVGHQALGLPAQHSGGGSRLPKMARQLIDTTADCGGCHIMPE